MKYDDNRKPRYEEEVTMRIERRMTVAFFLTLAAASAAGAKDTEEKAATGSPKASTRELTVSARAIERPLMKYRLFPAEYELQRGNAAPILLRVAWEQTPYFSKIVPTFSDYLDLPLNDPKLLSKNDVFDSNFYHALKRAAFKRTADWEYPLGEEPAATILLPDVQGARAIAGYGLSVWIRQHVARGQLAEAREAILVGMAVNRHYSRTPFLITQLVCAHLDSMLMTRIEELVSQPDCPNMYWALSALPRPLVDLRPSIELEQRFLQMSVPGLDDLDRLQTEEQWTKHALAAFDFYLQTPNEVAGRTLLAHAAKFARQELPESVDGGAERVARMSDAEAALRWVLRAQQEQSEETTALMSLDPQAAIPRLAALQKRMEKFYSKLGVPALQVVASTPNSYLVAHGLELRIDALRVVEAIRDYAAHHSGQVPPALDKIVDSPVPDNPLSGKPFQYEATPDGATLSAQGYQVNEKEIGAIQYRIKIRK
jgi:hypothetical protein